MQGLSLASKTFLTIWGSKREGFLRFKDCLWNSIIHSPVIWNIWNSVSNPIPIQRIVEFRATGSATNDDVEDNPNPDRQAVGVVYFYSLFRVVHGSHPWAGGASQGLFLFSLFFCYLQRRGSHNQIFVAYLHFTQLNITLSWHIQATTLSFSFWFPVFQKSQQDAAVGDCQVKILCVIVSWS